MNEDLVDLRSDTLSRPSPAMQQAMARAETGDDCFGEDKTVRALEEHMAGLFGKEAALLMPTGTMSNQVALRVLIDRGNEVICDASHHLNFFEAAQTADFSGVSLNSVDSKDGLLDVAALQAAIETRARWTQSYSTPRLVWHENTINGRGGRVVPLPLLQSVWDWAQARGLSVYIDGARIFNASVASGVPPAQYGQTASALSVCFAKGLGAPMGSTLIGSRDFIQQARRWRKWYGGGLHQSGVIAAAALYGLKHNIAQLAEDHENAKHFALGLMDSGCVDVVMPESNIALFDIGRLGVEPARFIAMADALGVKLLSWRGHQIRAVFFLNVSRRQTLAATTRIASLVERLAARGRPAGFPANDVAAT
ncbi:threonine aldolase family protein [Sorangium sp. So ce1151]|uniref:threonine aldolase family protein n=1 Tax=Sorangium sp. So ce1151 TaxID=3133332 RepID=UPI003F5D98B7